MNAKDEFQNEVYSKRILCAMIIIHDKNRHHTEAVLKKGYTDNDYNNFLQQLDYDYNNKNGWQNIYGTIWYTDGTWSERAEWDGEEWWDYNIAPEIPQECKMKEL